LTLGAGGAKCGKICFWIRGKKVGMAIRYFEARCQRDKELLRLHEELKSDLLA